MTYYKNKNPIRESILKSGYYKNGEQSIEEIFDRVSTAFSSNEEHRSRINKYLNSGWFVPATPVLSNAGSNKNMPISCFLNESEDTLKDIIETRVESEWLTSYGGGIGTNFSNIREVGSSITEKGESGGIIPFVLSNYKAVDAVMQAGSRRGSMAAYLHISHPEIEEFLYLRTKGGNYQRKALSMPSAHQGIIISDLFMSAVENDRKWYFTSPKDGSKTKHGINARSLWQSILTTRLETGEPYLLFEDNVNREAPESYKELGLKVKMSNLCVAPETEILTKKGWRRIVDTQDKTLEIWNGFEWSEVTPRQTGIDQELVTVKTSDGQQLDCTKYHKWFIQEGKKVVVKQTNELLLGDKIVKNDLPIITEDEQDLECAYSNGFYSGDGCKIKSGKKRFYFYGEKKKLLKRIKSELKTVIKENHQPKQDRIYFDTNYYCVLDKFFVPKYYHSIESRLDWLAGISDSDGTIANNGDNQSLQIGSVNKDFLLDIQKMLRTLGCNPKVTLARNSDEFYLPMNDGSGNNKLYKCKETNRILINSNDLFLLYKLGLRFDRLKYTPREPQRKSDHYVSIRSIEDNGRIDDTYCLTEPKRGSVLFNGILTGNCSEITLATGKDHLDKKRTAVCCLSSLNLLTYDEWKDNQQFMDDVVEFLDNVLQHFIDNAPDTVETARYSAMRERSIGLGVMGFHSYLQSHLIDIESEEAKKINKEIFTNIYLKAKESDNVLAENRGPNPDMEECNIKSRFSHIFAIAPTATIGKIAGQVSKGIEPFYSTVYLDKAKEGKNTVINPVFQKLLNDRNITDQDKIVQSIIKNDGDLRKVNAQFGFPFSAKEIKAFKPWKQIDQTKLIELAAQRQPFICQSQSLDILVDPRISKEKLHEIHWKAWKLGCKSLYYCRSYSVNDFGNKEDCESCQ